MEVVPTLLATIGASLSITSNIPQVYRVWKIPNKRSTDDISPLAICIHMLAAHYVGRFMDICSTCIY